MRFFLAGIACLVALGQLQRIEFPFARALYFHDVAIIIFLFAFFVQYGLKIFGEWRKDPVIAALKLWGIYVAANILLWFWNSPVQLLSGFLYLSRISVYVLFGCIVCALIKHQQLTKTQVKLGVHISIGIIAVLGLVQYIFLPDTRDLRLLGWDDHYYRLISTLFDPGFTGIVLGIGMLLTLTNGAKKSKTVLLKANPLEFTYRQTGYFLLLFCAFVLTYSRASYLAFAAGVVYIAVVYRKLYLLSLIGLLVLIIPLLPRPGGEGVRLERTASVSARSDSILQAVSSMQPVHWIIGKGWYEKKGRVMENKTIDGVVVPNHSTAPENSYVFVLTNLGIIGFILGCIVLYRLWLLGFSGSDVRVSLVAIGVHALFTNTFFYAFVVLLLSVLVAKEVGERATAKSVR